MRIVDLELQFNQPAQQPPEPGQHVPDADCNARAEQPGHAQLDAHDRLLPARLGELHEPADHVRLLRRERLAMVTGPEGQLVQAPADLVPEEVEEAPE